MEHEALQNSKSQNETMLTHANLSLHIQDMPKSIKLMLPQSSEKKNKQKLQQHLPLLQVLLQHTNRFCVNGSCDTDLPMFALEATVRV